MNFIYDFHTDCVQQALHQKSICPCCQREYLHSLIPAATTQVPTLSNLSANEEKDME